MMVMQTKCAHMLGGIVWKRHGYVKWGMARLQGQRAKVILQTYGRQEGAYQSNSVERPGACRMLRFRVARSTQYK